jgi:hypothetical protein
MAGSYTLEAEGVYTCVAKDSVLGLVVMKEWPRMEPLTLNAAGYHVLLSIRSLWKLEREAEQMVRFFWEIGQ